MDNLQYKDTGNNILTGSFQSFSGEPSDGFVSTLLVPFKRCQTKTLLEQFQSGIRLFDLHVRYDKKFKKFYPSCGIWSTGKALLQVMTELNKEVQKSDTDNKIYYILTLDNEVSKDNMNDLDIIGKFNTLSNSLNTFFKNCDLIEKRYTPVQKWYDRLLNDGSTEQLWSDDENSDIEWTDQQPTHFMPLLRYYIKKGYNYIYKKITGKEREHTVNTDGIEGMYILKEFV